MRTISIDVTREGWQKTLGEACRDAEPGDVLVVPNEFYRRVAQEAARIYDTSDRLTIMLSSELPKEPKHAKTDSV
jgi:hypothetical protein